MRGTAVEFERSCESAEAIVIKHSKTLPPSDFNAILSSRNLRRTIAEVYRICAKPHARPLPLVNVMQVAQFFLPCQTVGITVAKMKSDWLVMTKGKTHRLL